MPAALELLAAAATFEAPVGATAGASACPTGAGQPASRCSLSLASPSHATSHAGQNSTICEHPLLLELPAVAAGVLPPSRPMHCSTCANASSFRSETAQSGQRTVALASAMPEDGGGGGASGGCAEELAGRLCQECSGAEELAGRMCETCSG